MMCAAVCRRVPPRVAGIAVGVGGMACVKLPQVAVSAMKHCEPMGLRCVCMGGWCVCVCRDLAALLDVPLLLFVANSCSNVLTCCARWSREHL